MNESAFPSFDPRLGPNYEPPTGMSLRDYFAAKAMQGLVVRIGKHDTDLIAHDAYIMADAMLAARSK